MKTLLLGTIFLVMVIVFPMPTMAEVNVNIGIGIPLPPPVVFTAPPAVIVLPDTNYVYAVPYIDIDIFFWDGWWWRPWEGRWYRSQYYDRGWVYYNYVPRFYYDVDPGWRRHYKDHTWYGHQWHYKPIPYVHLQKNWKNWHDNRYWEKHGTWGVESYKPRSTKQMQELRHQRQEQYKQRPDVQQHQQQIKEQQKHQKKQQPKVQKSQKQQHSQGNPNIR